MEKAKISASQLFVLIFLFEIGSALWIPLGIDAEQDAWLAVFIGMIGGFILLWIYNRLYQYYPKKQLTDYVRDLLGNFGGGLVSFLYILYFVYLASFTMRELGETILTFAFPNMPLFIANTLFIIVGVYTVQKGIEVLARTGELLLTIEVLLLVTFGILIVSSGLINLSNLKPVLETGGITVLKIALTQTVTFPFGEIIVFTMIFPYLNQPKKLKKIGLGALGLSGLILTLTMVLNISVLGVNLTTRSQYPLLTLIQSIEIAGFLERLDVYFLLLLMIGSFIKICIFLYVSVASIASTFNINDSSRVVYPIGLVILLVSVIISSNYAQHHQIGFYALPIYIHLPFQVFIPLILLTIAYVKNKKNSNNKLTMHK